MKYTIEITRMRATADGKVVQNVQAMCIATDGEAEARESFDVDLGAPPEDEGDFIPFEDLTAEQVTAWVTAAYPARLMTRMHERLANRIAEQAAPAVVTMAPPWAEVQPA